MLNTEMKTTENTETTFEMPAYVVGDDYRTLEWRPPDKSSCCCCKPCDDEPDPRIPLETTSPEINYFSEDAVDATTEFSTDLVA